MAKKSNKSKDNNGTAERILELQQRVEELADDGMSFFESEDMPLALQEQFWQQVLASEESDWVSPFDLLVQGGMELPEPETLDDAALHLKLWELIRGLAMLRMFLNSTDHLSDRALYEQLFYEDLREEGPNMPTDDDSSWQYDLVAENWELYLRYYADEETRRDWAEDWPEDEMPAHEALPFDRDRHLPNSTQSQWKQGGQLN